MSVSQPPLAAGGCPLPPDYSLDLTTRLLVLGYGNTLRNDDSVGPLTAEAVENLNQPGVRALSCPLLTPELAYAISETETAIFVDAAVDGAAEVRLRPVLAATSSRVLTHTTSPATLLALARDVFGHEPAAWLLTITVEDLGLGQNLSPLAKRGLNEAIVQLHQLACKT